MTFDIDYIASEAIAMCVGGWVLWVSSLLWKTRRDTNRAFQKIRNLEQKGESKNG